MSSNLKVFVDGFSEVAEPGVPVSCPLPLEKHVKASLGFDEQ